MTEYRGELGILGSEEQWQQAKLDNEERLVQERKRAAEAAEDVAKLQHELDGLDALAWHYLKPELIATARITPRQHADYKEYRRYALEHGWPHDDPRTLFAFLARDLSHPSRVRRLHNSIQSVIHSTSLKDITNDPIVRALIGRLVRKQATSSPQAKEQN